MADTKRILAVHKDGVRQKQFTQTCWDLLPKSKYGWTQVTEIMQPEIEVMQKKQNPKVRDFVLNPHKPAEVPDGVVNHIKMKQNANDALIAENEALKAKLAALEAGNVDDIPDPNKVVKKASTPRKRKPRAKNEDSKPKI